MLCLQSLIILNFQAAKRDTNNSSNMVCRMFCIGILLTSNHSQLKFPHTLCFGMVLTRMLSATPWMMLVKLWSMYLTPSIPLGRFKLLKSQSPLLFIEVLNNSNVVNFRPIFAVFMNDFNISCIAFLFPYMVASCSSGCSCY